GCWVLKACQQYQLDVPSQIAVVGVDNFELLCGFSSPQLSSVAQSSYRIGFEAASMLHQLMSGQELASELVLIQPFGVVARQSTDILAVQDEEVVQALRFIRNQDADLSVADVLEHMSVSRRSMEIRFKNAMGHSIEQELINVRISRAKQLLTATSLPITQIALRSGYKSSTGFSAAFRKETGLSPRDYRKQVTTPPKNVWPND
ncbi:MAG: helix-turn-helix domain-containing protein, partial [Planctomycetales bacterium]|nr:helix-turn-helix domain-containing protein [Planctomycetales bacterium]